MPRFASPLAALLALTPMLALAGPIHYPDTRAGDTSDDYHGTTVADPYRWLEDDVRESSDVSNWVDAQNEVTNAYLESLKYREPIEKRLTELWDYERFSAPQRIADYYIYSYNNGLQNQSVLYIVDSHGGEPRILIDPNTWTDDGTASLAGTEFSHDGKHLAFGRADSGSDWKTWRIMDVATGELLADSLTWIKWGSPRWTPDGRGFFYTRFPEPEEGQAFQSLNLNSKVYYHRLNTPQSADVLVFEQPDHPDWNLVGDVTEDGRYLLIYASTGTDNRNRLWVRDLADPYAAPWALADTFEHEWSVIGNDGPFLYMQTDFDAPNKRVLKYDIRAGKLDVAAMSLAENMSADLRDVMPFIEIIPESKNPLTSTSLTANMLVCTYLKDVQTQVRMFRTDGTHVRDVEFPGIGVASGFGGKREHLETFYSFSSLATPPTIYRYDMITGASELFRQAKVDFNPDDYEVTQQFYTSKDGTRVPIFLAHKKGITLDGTNPTLLYGYGGFDISMLPYFSVTRLAWMEMGGVYAMANLRGGGEYGQAWHKAGTKTTKQNVFDDFIAAAEFLIAQKYTSPDKLAIMGGSNGGLLVGACMTQRPDLFGAALPIVGVMDMLRFHKFTAGRAWVDDYGSAENPDEFKALYAYSPYHQLLRQQGKGIEYPPTMVMTADTDDRVVPGHSFKFAAALQKAQAGDAPVLIRIEAKAGHGAGKPTKKLIEETADMWSFLADSLDFEPEIGSD